MISGRPAPGQRAPLGHALRQVLRQALDQSELWLAGQSAGHLLLDGEPPGPAGPDAV
ncbi:hypothetical protein [Kineococcus sp. SYSU DK005]|uniref:hypothetical protein n=1 Tax=Kineococcus sp. SYSU DK005 TaxID=3383126 RepID=UPI003D7DB4BD